MPQILEVIKHTDSDSSIILGNLGSPAIELGGILIQNWTDMDLNLSKGTKLLTIAFDQGKTL